MVRHAVILTVAVLSALVSAKGLMALASPPAAPVRATAAPPPAPAPAPMAMSAGGAPAQIAKSADGHYWAQAEVNGRWVKFLVDTGASAVALTAADARRLGLDLDTLEFSRPVATANGQAMAATVTLDHVTVAGARLEDVDALVVREGLSTSLLGMTYLGRLSRFEATRNALILRP